MNLTTLATNLISSQMRDFVPDWLEGVLGQFGPKVANGYRRIDLKALPGFEAVRMRFYASTNRRPLTAEDVNAIYFLSPAVRPEYSPSVSGYPLGQVSDVGSSTGGSVLGHRTIVWAQARQIAWKESGRWVRQPLPRNWQGTFEGILRWATAYAEYSLAPKQPYVCDVAVSLESWAKENELAYAFNRADARASVQTKQGLLIVPLTSPRVKLGDKWLDVPGVVVANQAGPLLPKRLLDSLN